MGQRRAVRKKYGTVCVSEGGENIVEEKESSGRNERKGRGAKGQGITGFLESVFEELDATIDAIVEFPKLRLICAGSSIVYRSSQSNSD
jgi:hypothetical protein